ncbi:hypothetical protein FKM82_020722 [Ascaphus truei]
MGISIRPSSHQKRQTAGAQAPLRRCSLPKKTGGAGATGQWCGGSPAGEEDGLPAREAGSLTHDGEEIEQGRGKREKPINAGQNKVRELQLRPLRGLNIP